MIGYFRSASPIVSVIKYLSPKYKIGVLFQKISAKDSVKIKNYHEKFVDFCTHEGAILISEDTVVSTKLLLVQQYIYNVKFVSNANKNIDYKKIIGMLGLASSGIDEHDYFINQFHINELTVPDLSLLKHLLFERNKVLNYDNKTIVEVGLPFKNYPIFDDLEIPWIVATPTLFSFTSEFEKNIFLKDILSFINKNARNDIVYYKPHNGSVDDYFKVKKVFVFTVFIYQNTIFMLIF